MRFFWGGVAVAIMVCHLSPLSAQSPSLAPPKSAVPANEQLHDHDHDHDHDHQGHGHHHGRTVPLMTTRPESRVLPLPKQEDVFQFVVYGDRTGGVPAGLKVLEQAVRDTNLLDPDLVMTVGDLIQGYNTTKEWMPQMREYKAIMNGLKMRWFPVAGNHDVYWRGPGETPAGHHEASYEQHFGPLWYSFGHKHAGFIVLYSDEGDPETNEKSFSVGRLQRMSDQQLKFLEQALQQLADKQHVFLFLHHPRWIGGGYQGGNWEKVHQMLKKAGNVSAVFAGHIHHMRFDGPRDGIAYYTLATTGGHLSAEIPDAGYLHHLNVVTVRPNSYTVAALPIGSVIDPKEFDAEFLQQLELARSIRPRVTEGAIELTIDGAAEGELVVQLSNPSEYAIEGTASIDGGSQWVSSLDHHHFKLPPGGQATMPVRLERSAGSIEQLQVPRFQVDLEMLGATTRVRLPETQSPLEVSLAGVPADYFDGDENRCLQVTGEAAAIEVEAQAIEMPQGPLTLEAWVRTSQQQGHRGIIAKTQSSEYALFFDEGVPQFDMHLNGRYVSAKAKTKLPVDQWVHLAGVYDGKEVRLYVDGKLVDAKPGGGKRTPNRLPLFIGADPDGRGRATRSFLGAIDEVRLSSTARYTDTFKPTQRHSPDESTRLLMHLDRTFGPFVLDHSDQAVTGTLGPQAKLVPAER